ncbi:ankyrin repeat domain-containing protein [Urechidicola croceus]|uniref:Uncharacterized protein n=1 Tax=Urechidicola croceus TaxID=1850246 RepID=A0A1D8P8A1_9FLAO|nr:ankyrin repeat domain-containing protein [Urechidicola croceus]AOW20803.1 hypothetical protein LPB138_08995 [Urechidicola croceus]
MKNLLLTSLFILALGLNSNAKNSAVKNNSSSNVLIVQTKVNTFCKLIQMGEYDAVKNLIKTGTNINQKSMGLTPLMYAARQNKTEIVKLLIENGAKLKIKSDKGYTALEYAKMSKANDAFNIIKEALDA